MVPKVNIKMNQMRIKRSVLLLQIMDSQLLGLPASDFGWSTKRILLRCVPHKMGSWTGNDKFWTWQAGVGKNSVSNQDVHPAFSVCNSCKSLLPAVAMALRIESIKTEVASVTSFMVWDPKRAPWSKDLRKQVSVRKLWTSQSKAFKGIQRLQMVTVHVRDD